MFDLFTNSQSLSSKLVPVQLIEQYVMRYAGYAKRKQDGVIYAGCPVCKEDNGKYWGKRARLYFIPTNEGGYLFCHNCQKNWNPLEWMSEVSGKPKEEILSETDNYSYLFLDNTLPDFKTQSADLPDLPINSINLSDPFQTSFYSDNYIVKTALKTIKSRKLDTAVNKCDLFISLDDPTHMNRLCIPFKGVSGKTEYYQTRALFKEDEENGKYIGKYGSDKAVFGLNSVDASIGKMFVTEGPIDAMFVRNGIAMAGLSMTNYQTQQINSIIGCELIWIIDNQFENPDVVKDYQKLIKRGERLFMWGEEFSMFKDINDYCKEHNVNEFPHSLIMSRVYEGNKAMSILQKRIKNVTK